MYLNFSRTKPAFAVKHPASIEAGDFFDDLDADGNQCTYMAIRRATRLARSNAYRIVALNVTNGTITLQRFAETRNIQITGFTHGMDIAHGPADPTLPDEDPAIAERDAQLEAMSSEQLGWQDDEQHVED